MSIAIIGSGLAGAAAAYVLKTYGMNADVFEAGDKIAPGASGNERGILNPRFFADYNPQAQFYGEAFKRTIKLLEEGPAAGFQKTGALHLINTDQKEKRFRKMRDSWPWLAEDMRLLSADEASDVVGVRLDKEALYLPQSGFVSPKELCEFYLQNVPLHLSTPITNIKRKAGGYTLKNDKDAYGPYAHVIVAAGMHTLSFINLPLLPRRGQVTYVKETLESKRLKTIVCYGGYVTPAKDGRHCVGSTFDREDTGPSLKEADDDKNLKSLAENIPALAGGFAVENAWAGVRTTSRDKFPIVGEVNDGMYVSTAHGSHGIISSLMGAYVLAEHIAGKPCGLSEETVAALSPGRFK